MKHYPAHRFSVIQGVSHSHAQRAVPLKTVVLLCAMLFAAGFTAAVWTIGMMVTAP